MRITGNIEYPSVIRDILEHIGIWVVRPGHRSLL